jgi:hypothetical protein
VAANEIIVKKNVVRLSDGERSLLCNADPEREQPGATPAEGADLVEGGRLGSRRSMEPQKRDRSGRPGFNGVFRSVADLQAAINRFVEETNSDPTIFMVVKPFQSLRLQHDKVRNEFDAYCLVQHQVPRL